MSRASRRLTVKMSQSSGTINRFYAFLNGERVIAADGNASPAYSTTVSMSPVTLKVRVWGIDTATYDLWVDLPGTADEQDLTLTLSEGYHELELSL